MSYTRSRQEAMADGNFATKVIDGETSTSPVRDGGSDVGGAPIATSLGGGATDFTQTRTRTGVQDHPVGTNVRQYGQKNKTSYK